jgi:hypothetical protein
MKAKILSATPKEYNKKDGTKGTLYTVISDNGKTYSCFSNRIPEKVGQEVEFDEVENTYNNTKQYVMNLAKENNIFQQKAKSYGKSHEELIITAKCMVLSYCKDLVVSCTGTEVLTVGSASESLISAFKTVWPAIGIENDLKSKFTPPAAATVPIPEHPRSTLRQALIAILENKMKKSNFRAKDMVDLAATEGIELKYDQPNDSIVWLISEEEANKLITILG